MNTEPHATIKIVINLLLFMATMRHCSNTYFQSIAALREYYTLSRHNGEKNEKQKEIGSSDGLFVLSRGYYKTMACVLGGFEGWERENSRIQVLVGCPLPPS
jgi:hypothetical protein